MCVCIQRALFQHSATHTPSQNQYLCVSSVYMRLSVPLFVDRLQLCRHMTFRSSCFHLANPCGALATPAEVMDDFCLYRMRLISQMCAILQKRRRRERGCDIASRAEDSPERLLKRDTCGRPSETSDMYSLRPSLSLLSHFLHPYVMTPGMLSAVMSAPSPCRHKKLVIKMTSHVP